MKEFSFLRRPTKIILYGILFFLMVAVCLIFALQYVLDGITMEHAIETYAYTGTIYSCVEEDPFYKVVQEDILEQLVQSEYVEVLDVRETYSGQAEGMKQVTDRFISMHTLDNFCMLEAEVTEVGKVDRDISYYTLKPQTVWGGIELFDKVDLLIHNKGTMQYLEKGDRAFLIGHQEEFTLAFYQRSNLEGYTPYTLLPIADFEAFEQTLYFKNPFIILPDDLDEAETKQYIQSFLEETGWDKWLEKKKATECMFTVRTVSDMALLTPFVDGTALLTEGRELAASDIGSKVCVISETIAEINNVNVGDMISLALADTSYVVDEAYEPHLGWESGFPGEQDELLSYGEAEEYEVVGIYKVIQKDLVNDCFLYSKNDIFIPQLSDSYEAAVKTARPYEISFRILGPDYDAFMDELEAVFYEQGYVVDVVDSGWENVEDAFAAMQSRRGLVLFCAVLAFAAAVAAFDVLLLFQFRYEYGLCKLQGAYEREAGRIFYAGFVVTAIPAVLCAGLTAFVTYQIWMKEQVSSYISEAVFGTGDCILLLAAGGLLVVLVAFVVLRMMILRIKQSSVLKLLR